MHVDGLTAVGSCQDFSLRAGLWWSEHRLPMLPIPTLRATTYAALALLLVAWSSDTAFADGSRHPDFDDRGTLPWHRSSASARRAARRQGKLVFIEFGRKRCTNCRRLAEDILPQRAVRARMGRVAVGLAANCDHPEREVVRLFRRHLKGARTLPFVAFITPDGRWVTGWAGGINVNRLRRHLDVAEQTQRRLFGSQSTNSNVRAARRSTITSPVAASRSAPRRRPPARPPARADCGAECVGDACKPPSLDLPCLPNPLQLLARRCPPKRTVPTEPAPTRVSATSHAGFTAFPPPQRRPASHRARPQPCTAVPIQAPSKAASHEGLFTSRDILPTLADLERDVRTHMDWEQAWHLFRRASASVDAPRRTEKTR